MKTFYCIDCLRITQQLFTETSKTEDLLASVCDSCKRALKAEMDAARAQLNELGKVDPQLNEARRILHEQGVRA